MICTLVLAAYTNHAGLAVSGVPVRLESRYVTLSNATETVRVPLSIFPRSEQRRLGADCGSARFVPQEIRQALAGVNERIRRAEARQTKDLMTREECERIRTEARAARRAYLDAAVETGRLTAQERTLLLTRD